MFKDKLTWDYWSEDLAIGVAAIDDDHRRILGLIATLREAIDMADPGAVVARTLATLEVYVERHFQREETLLAAAGYPALDSHRAIHDTFRRYVREEQKAEGATEVGALLSYLVNWWIGHIATDDKLYRSVAVNNAAALAAIADLPPLRE